MKTLRSLVDFAICAIALIPFLVIAALSSHDETEDNEITE